MFVCHIRPLKIDWYIRFGVVSGNFCHCNHINIFVRQNKYFFSEKRETSKKFLHDRAQNISDIENKYFLILISHASSPIKKANICFEAYIYLFM